MNTTTNNNTDQQVDYTTEQYLSLHNFSRYVYDKLNHKIINVKTNREITQFTCNGYRCVSLTRDDNTRRRITVARAMMHTKRKLNRHDYVDHIDRDKLNDTFDNLRIVTARENCLNRDKSNIQLWTTEEEFLLQGLIDSGKTLTQIIDRFSHYRTRASVQNKYTRTIKAMQSI